MSNAQKMTPEQVALVVMAGIVVESIESLHPEVVPLSSITNFLEGQGYSLRGAMLIVEVAKRTGRIKNGLYPHSLEFVPPEPTPTPHPA